MFKDSPEYKALVAKAGAATDRRKAAIHQYLESLKETIYREGRCNHEDGTISTEIWEVSRHGEVINEMLAWNNFSHVCYLWVHEAIRAEGHRTGWSASKLHAVFFGDDGSIKEAAIIDFDGLRRAIETPDDCPALSKLLSESGLIATQTTHQPNH